MSAPRPARAVRPPWGSSKVPKPHLLVRPLHQVFAVPALLAGISLIGLLSALVADGVWDALSWLALGGVVAVALWHGWPSPPWSRRTGTIHSEDMDRTSPP